VTAALSVSQRAQGGAGNSLSERRLDASTRDVVDFAALRKCNELQKFNIVYR
jgi:hypothetical protein